MAIPSLSLRASVRLPWPRFQSPLIKPDVRISRTLCCRQHRAPELGTPGSVGAAGGQPPAATRPAFAGKADKRHCRHSREGGNPPAFADRAGHSTGRINRRRSCRHSREGGNPPAFAGPACQGTGHVHRRPEPSRCAEPACYTAARPRRRQRHGGKPAQRFRNHRRGPRRDGPPDQGAIGGGPPPGARGRRGPLRGRTPRGALRERQGTRRAGADRPVLVAGAACGPHAARRAHPAPSSSPGASRSGRAGRSPR